MGVLVWFHHNALVSQLAAGLLSLSCIDSMPDGEGRNMGWCVGCEMRHCAWLASQVLPCCPFRT
jgi:hypothetical protein